MSLEMNIGNTGNKVVDSLQGLQIVLDRLETVEEKAIRIRQGMGLLGIKRLMEHSFMVSAVDILALGNKNNPNECLLFGDELTFTGKLTTVEYIIQPEIPIDSLTLCFEDPTILDIIDDEDATERMKQYKLEVPVLSIGSCVDLAA